MESNIFTFDYSKQKNFNFYFCADVHLESPHFNKNLFIQEMTEAQKMKAPIYIGGDFWSLLSPKDFKRYTAGNDTISQDALINHLLDIGVDLLKPFVNDIVFISTGNHETTYLKYHGVDITLFLVDRLNQIRDKKLPPIVYGGYSGFIRFLFKFGNKGNVKHLDLYYNHGQGSSAEVTDGIIDLKRRQYIVADLIWLQHKHKKVLNTWSRSYLTPNGKIKNAKVIGFITGCFDNLTQEYDINKHGYKLNYGEERMRTPIATGGAFMKVSVGRKIIYRVTLT